LAVGGGPGAAAARSRLIDLPGPADLFLAHRHYRVGEVAGDRVERRLDALLTTRSYGKTFVLCRWSSLADEQRM